MNIEREIFKRSKFDFEKLLLYGFKKEENHYIFSKEIMDNAFQVIITITNDGAITGLIYDLSFHEEYTNFRIENQVGVFVSQVREAYKSVLEDIKSKCTTANYFITDQANRITHMVKEKYNDSPDFPWESSPGNGIFRNPQNDKWYGLIMNINKGKIDKGDYEVEIINVKLHENKIPQLLKKKGYYKAYHMNKKNWISIILDDTYSDEEIMSRIEESHAFTESLDEWLIPANPKYYDIMNCFNEVDTILWKQSNHMKIGDIVYLYIAAPYSAIMYQCYVEEVDIPYQYEDKNLSMKKVMKIKLLKRYEKDAFTFDRLKTYGIHAIRGPRRIDKKLSEKLKEY
ncbi:MAG: MmcQ/YjbR family DNA-binding protein [Firmicutes bacterium]|nr:MmcQ/YjbR family DNA-binding protein [Bacillota bacterium]